MGNFIIIVLLIIVFANISLWHMLERSKRKNAPRDWYKRQEERDEAKRRNKEGELANRRQNPPERAFNSERLRRAMEEKERLPHTELTK